MSGYGYSLVLIGVGRVNTNQQLMRIVLDA
jgi:hypothetical protein